MSLVILIVGLIIFGIIVLAEAFQPKSNYVPSKEELDQMMRDITGKSQKERKKIIDKYMMNKDSKK